jgi:ribosomal protein S18 acetylase RimI-like enzyme
MSPSIEIARVDSQTATAYARFLTVNSAESGTGGGPHFAVATTIDPKEARGLALERWARPLSEPTWCRAWLLWDDDPEAMPPRRRVVGEAELRGGRVASEMHRAVLGMGLLKPYRKQGWGTRLAKQAIAWGRESGLAYIDLGVFAENTPAIALYNKLGFAEISRRTDAFRLNGGVVIDDIQMTLAL